MLAIRLENYAENACTEQSLASAAREGDAGRAGVTWSLGGIDVSAARQGGQHIAGTAAVPFAREHQVAHLVLVRREEAAQPVNPEQVVWSG